MKQTLFFIGLLFFSTGTLMAQKGIVESFRPTVAPVVDGVMTDWETEWLNDAKGRFSYNIANDDDNLYYRIKIVDDITQRKVALFGLSVLLNPEGKKPGKLGLKFPMGLDPAEIKNIKSPEGPITEATIVNMNKFLIKDAEALELIGLAKEHIVSSRLGLMNGIQLIILADDKGDYYYEGKIPFKAFKIKRSAVKTLGVSLQTGKMAHSNGPAAGNSLPNGGAPGGGYGGGGYGSGGYGGMGGSSFGQTGYMPYNEFQISTVMSVGVILK